MSDDIHALSGAYAVDALDDVERARFERHLAGCTACQAEVSGLRAAAGELAAMSEQPPPAGLRARVMADITRVRPLPPLTASEAEVAGAGGAVADVPHGDAAGPATTPTTGPTTGLTTGAANGGGADGTAYVPEPVPGAGAEPTPLAPRRARRSPWRGLVAAAAALVLVVSGYAVWRTTSTDPARALADQVLAAPDATRVAKSFPDGSTATVWRSDSLHKAVIVTTGMAAAPSGKVYQLWLQDPTGHMASAGVMPPGADQVVVLDGDASKATGAGITLEPAGGSGQPTSDPIAVFTFA